jgi:uncharacterized membrane protein YcaP (DUF421 family)
MQIVIRAAVMFFFVWFLTRSMGKKELSDLSVFEMILLIVMGDLIQQAVTQQDQSVTGGMLAIATIGLLVLLFSNIAYRWGRTRAVIEGVPVIVVMNGRPVESMMRLERLSMDELKDAAREQGIVDLREVRVAVLEPEGQISFLKADGGDDGGAGEKSASHHIKS